jgi:hypothetical protein
MVESNSYLTEKQRKILTAKCEELAALIAVISPNKAGEISRKQILPKMIKLLNENFEKTDSELDFIPYKTIVRYADFSNEKSPLKLTTLPESSSTHVGFLKDDAKGSFISDVKSFTWCKLEV